MLRLTRTGIIPDDYTLPYEGGMFHIRERRSKRLGGEIKSTVAPDGPPKARQHQSERAFYQHRTGERC